MSPEQILLVYDGECPACSNFSQVVRIRANVGDLRIVDARQDSDIRDELTKLGLDLDQGMALKMGGQIYYGAEALHALALISSRSGTFNRANYWIFKSKPLSRLLYPILRFFRNLLLKILRKNKINNLNIEGNDEF